MAPGLPSAKHRSPPHPNRRRYVRRQNLGCTYPVQSLTAELQNLLSDRSAIMAKLTLSINSESRTVDVALETPLLWVLRDHLNLVGTKYGCGLGLCGSCTVHVNGEAVRSCQLPVSAVGTSKVVTIEGLAASAQSLTPIQQVWCDHDVAQCGYCQAGQIMSASALLAKNPKPTDEDIDSAMAGNLCRCGTYLRIRKAIHTAAQNLSS
jgi:isoquinoline 1-oxidoreductase alpha subunit